MKHKATEEILAELEADLLAEAKAVTKKAFHKFLNTFGDQDEAELHATIGRAYKGVGVVYRSAKSILEGRGGE